MTTSAGLSFTIFKVIYDTAFAVTMMPLRRSTIVDLGVESTGRFSFFKYGSWTLQAFVLAQKAFELVYRSTTAEMSVYSILHFVEFFQVLVGALATVATITKADEAVTYFQFHNSFCKKWRGKFLLFHNNRLIFMFYQNFSFTGLKGRSTEYWWHDKGAKGPIYFIILADITLFVSFAGAYATSPQDPMFFQSLASKFLDGWMLVLVSAVCEIVSLTGAVSSSLFGILCGITYMYDTALMSRYRTKSLSCGNLRR